MLAAEDNADVREAHESVGKEMDDLESFLLKPKAMKSIELLEHMHAFAMRDPKYQLRMGAMSAVCSGMEGPHDS